MQLNCGAAKALEPSSRASEDSVALYDALSDLVRAYQFRDRDRICCHDISVTQCYALEMLVKSGPLRMNALAEQLFLDKSTASRVIDALERKGYVERTADLEDGRAVALRHTAAGKKLFERIRNDLISEHEAMMSDLSPAARRAAAEVIARLARAAEKRFGCEPTGECGSTCAPKPARARK